MTIGLGPLPTERCHGGRWGCCLCAARYAWSTLTHVVCKQDADFHARVHLVESGARGTDAPFSVLHSLAEEGDTQSQLDLAWAYLGGKEWEDVDVPDRRERARRWFEKAHESATEESNRALAQAMLDTMDCQDNVRHIISET